MAEQPTLIDAEAQGADTRRRVRELREFVGDAGNLPILVHPDPDPDALASALAVRALLRRGPDDTPIVTLDDMTRPENRRMVELLGMRVTVVTQDELRKFDRVIAVDHQPLWLAERCPDCVGVIDHHPIEQEVAYRWSDLRPDYGATATLLTEYSYADDPRRIDDKLASALLYGIKTDTDSLTRGGNGADVKAYAYLMAIADGQLLRKLERASYKTESARAYGEALARLGISNDVAVAFLGRLDEGDTHILVDIADFCMSLEEITWAVAAAVIDGQVLFTLRNLGTSAGAGDLAKLIAGDEGSGGGHTTMARARLPVAGEWSELVDAGVEEGTELLLKRVTAAIERLRANPQSFPPVRPVTNHPAAS